MRLVQPPFGSGQVRVLTILWGRHCPPPTAADAHVSASLLDVSDDVDLAKRYRAATAAAAESSVDAEPEAQLTSPVKELFETIGTDSAGELTLIREAQLDGVRPDFAALHRQRPCGWVELKAPERTVDTSKWRGREAKQWARLAELDALIVCNGELAQLYLEGQPAYDPVELPLHDDEGWSSGPLRVLLLRFREARPTTIKRVSQLAMKLAPMTRLLRDRVRKLLDAPGVTPMRRGLDTWAAHVHNGVDAGGFANDLAQVIAYSLAMAALRGGADTNEDSLISLDEARHSIEGTSPVLTDERSIRQRADVAGERSAGRNRDGCHAQGLDGRPLGTNGRLPYAGRP